MKPAKAPRRSLLPLLVLAVLAGLVIGAVWWATRPGPLLIQGEVAAPRVDVSARTSGRVTRIEADLGQRVENVTDFSVKTLNAETDRWRKQHGDVIDMDALLWSVRQKTDDSSRR